MDVNVNKKLAIAVGAGAALLTAAAAYKAYNKTSPQTSNELVKSWKPVAKVSAIHIYPIKSCQGVKVDEAEVTNLGLVNGELQDRSFMVVNDKNNFMHARIHPEMLLIKVNVGKGMLELTAPNMDPVAFPVPPFSGLGYQVRTVRVWGDEVSAFDCGEDAANWLSLYILKKDSGARLVYLPYSSKTPRPFNPKPIYPWQRKSDGPLFQDLSPFHILSTESAEDLKSRVDGEAPVSTLNFRPTITVSGCQPYDEDEWRFVRIGEDAVLRFVQHCERCLLTTIDPSTGIKHPTQEPLRTLRKYRLAQDPELRRAIGESPLMGINLSLDRPGKIRVGDVIFSGQL